MNDTKQTRLLGVRKHLSFSATALLLIAGSGCKTLGPRALKWERTPYNLAVQETQDAQLLLNLVRLKYRDTPVFLELSSITSQFTFASGLGNGDTALAEVTDGSVTWKPGFNLTFTAQPTVIYTPLQGEKFAQQLLAPLRIETLMLLYRSGWPLKRVLQIGVQRLNRVENATRASGPTPGRAPKYEGFARVAELMAELNHRGHLDLVYAAPTPTGESARIVMAVDAEAFRLPEMKELSQLLGLVKDKKQYPVTPPIVEEAGQRELDHLEVETRSLQGVLFFLSQSVDVPESHVQAGQVTVTRIETGEVFDWKNVTRELLRIQSSPTHRARTAISIQYRGDLVLH